MHPLKVHSPSASLVAFLPASITTPFLQATSPSAFCVRSPLFHLPLPYRTVFSPPYQSLPPSPRMNAALPAHAASGITLVPADVTLSAAIAAAVFAYLFLLERLTAHHLLNSTTTRKIVHISCGPAFYFLWPFFSDAASARFVAAAIPLSFMAALIVSGSARKTDARRAALGRAISRQGDPTEALQGPLYYCSVLLVTTILLFKTSVAGVAIMQLCFGDGTAEVFGRLFGAQTQWGLSWTGNKSIAGTSAFTISAFVGSCLAVSWSYYWDMGHLLISSPATVGALVAISLLCAVLELVPKNIVYDDNLTISVAAAILCFFFFGSSAF